MNVATQNGDYGEYNIRKLELDVNLVDSQTFNKLVERGDPEQRMNTNESEEED